MPFQDELNVGISQYFRLTKRPFSRRFGHWLSCDYFMLDQYVKEGADELGAEKLTPLLRLATEMQFPTR